MSNEHTTCAVETGTGLRRAGLRGSPSIEESSVHLSGVGIWSGELRFTGEPRERGDMAAELEQAGYTALWMPGGHGGEVLAECGNLLDATSTATVATGILNLWMHDPADVATGHHALTAAHPDRFLLGIGIGHAMMVDADQPGRYQRPVATTREYLDALDAAASPVPRQERVLAALGPKMLELSRDRAGGAHPYLVTPEHTRIAREVVGDDRAVLPEQAVILESDPSRAREIARAGLTVYFQLPNYTNNWRRLGFTDDDLVDGGSDRLIDALVAWGDEQAIARRVQEHFDAGADHVCIQLLTDAPRHARFPRDEWLALAPALRTLGASR
jgi:probable F420-dependent oxidoreductase